MFPALTYDASRAFYLVAFQYEWLASDLDIYYSWINHRWQLVEPDMVITRSGSNEGRPAAGCDNKYTYLVAWEDGRNGVANGSDIYASFVLAPALYLPLVRR